MHLVNRAQAVTKPETQHTEVRISGERVGVRRYSLAPQDFHSCYVLKGRAHGMTCETLRIEDEQVWQELFAKSIAEGANLVEGAARAWARVRASLV